MNNQPIIDTTSKQDEYIEILKKHFPSVINQLDDGSYTIDKEQLQLMVEPKNCKIIEDGYGLKWVGKKEAYHNAYIHNNKILKPLVDDSKHFDTTSNILIKGDNLDALKLLKKNYFEKIKMIYIDPPYNTQSDGFIYNDNFTKSQEDVLEELGYSEDQKEYIKNIAGAKTHSGWLSFMYPRLLLARDLLKDDGVIFISIDDNEQANLKLLCDEVFGQENFLACIARKTKLTSNKGTQFSPSHEYILSYAKSLAYTNQFNDLNAQKSENYISLFKNKDERGSFNEVSLYMPALKGDRPSRYYITCPDNSKVIPPGDRFWRWSENTFNKNKLENRVIFKQTKTSPLLDEFNNQAKWNIYTKLYLHERLESGLRPGTFITDWPNSIASKELIKHEIPFSYAKPWQLIKYLIEISTPENNDIILDFFAGSGTTGDAVMQLNAEDGGNRKFILVQLPEKIDPKNSEAYKFVSEKLKKEPTIFEITAERLRRAGTKIKAELEQKNQLDLLNNGDKPNSLDIGFKVYEIVNDRYNAIYDKAFNEIHQDDLDNLLADDNTQIDSLTILTNLLLGSGITLDTKIDVLIADSLYRVDDKLFILKEFDLQPELFNGVEYATIYARYFTNDSFIANLTSFIDKDKIIVKG